MRTIDNLVVNWEREATGIWRVELRRPVDGLFTGDQVQWEGVIWTVWKINATTLTLTR